MKPAIAGILAFVLSLAGTTGIVMLRHRPAPADTTAARPADSTRTADSTAGRAGDSLAAGDSAGIASRSPADSAPPAAGTASGAVGTGSVAAGTGSVAVPSSADSAKVAAVAPLPKPPAGPVPQTAPVVPGAKPASAALQGLRAASMPGAPVAAGRASAPTPEEKAAFKQLGKILGNMKPAEAAKVLGFLSDAEVEGVFRQLQPRQAGALLAALPQQRAGALGRRLLETVPGGGN